MSACIFFYYEIATEKEKKRQAKTNSVQLPNCWLLLTNKFSSCGIKNDVYFCNWNKAKQNVSNFLQKLRPFCIRARVPLLPFSLTMGCSSRPIAQTPYWHSSRQPRSQGFSPPLLGGEKPWKPDWAADNSVRVTFFVRYVARMHKDKVEHECCESSIIPESFSCKWNLSVTRNVTRIGFIRVSKDKTSKNKRSCLIKSQMFSDWQHNKFYLVLSRTSLLLTQC